MTFEEFENYMEGIKCTDMKNDVFKKALSVLDHESESFGNIYATEMCLMLELLSLAMGDKYNKIAYYVFDLDWGNKPDTLHHLTKGKCTLKKLYNLITNET